MRDSILIKNAKCYKCYFLAFETQKTYSIKICICYKICNLAIVPTHFWERTIARLYNILLIYLFSLQLSVSLPLTSLSFLISLVHSSSPTSLSFPHSLSLSFPHSLPQQDRMFEIGLVARRMAWWHEIGVEEIDVETGVEFGVLCVFLWLLWLVSCGSCGSFLRFLCLGTGPEFWLREGGFTVNCVQWFQPLILLFL